jgi:hypothetical protein
MIEDMKTFAEKNEKKKTLPSIHLHETQSKFYYK